MWLKSVIYNHRKANTRFTKWDAKFLHLSQNRRPIRKQVNRKSWGEEQSLKSTVEMFLHLKSKSQQLFVLFVNHQWQKEV